MPPRSVDRPTPNDPFRWEHFDFKGLRIAYFDSRSAPKKGTLLIAHANGYSAGCYLYYARRLATEYRVLGLDFAGHGRSEATTAFRDWNFFRDQILAFCSELGLDRAIAMGHSLGGACLLRAAAVAPGLFERVVALDPVILHLGGVAFLKVFGNPMSKVALGRRAVFKSRDLLRRAFRKFGWQHEVFEDYLDHCFTQSDDGGLRLACPPQVEARVFSCGDFGSLLAYGSVRTETHIVLPKPHRVCSPRAARRILRGHHASSLTELPGSGHLFPFEEPEQTFAVISRKLGTVQP